MSCGLRCRPRSVSSVTDIVIRTVDFLSAREPDTTLAGKSPLWNLPGGAPTMSDQDNHGVCPTRCFNERSNVMTRIFLFVGTNLAILFILNISLRVLASTRCSRRRAGGINVTALLVISAVFGMGGSFISLAISKWMAIAIDPAPGSSSARESHRAVAARHRGASGAAGRHRHAGRWRSTTRPRSTHSRRA